MCFITIVDDDRDFLELFKLYMEHCGCPVGRSFYNPKDAFFDNDWDKTDIGIFDVHMPEMDGIELAKKVRKDYPQVKIILLSAMDSEEHQNLQKTGKVDYFIPKSGVVDVGEFVKELCDGG